MTDSALATLAVAWNGAGSAYVHGRTQRCTSKTQESAREPVRSRAVQPLHSTCSRSSVLMCGYGSFAVFLNQSSLSVFGSID